VRTLTVDRVAGAALAVFALLVLWESRKIPFGTVADPGPGAVPVLLAVLLLVCSIAVIALGKGGDRIAAVAWTEWRHALAILGACALLAAAFERLGYRLSLFLTLIALVKLVERKGWVASLAFAAGFALGTHYLFSTLLRVQLPRGVLGF
jgi:putative tricarboxylic transport membrane protein